ncbi:hypothetical protein JRO89_XS07G0278900 [Xanthoceras sorbifolium]|uniref:F-box associated domain-containing protein n=1 Tax=Xanthoceras sorbifolium TaxID=99658 RepID=A0ABQ8HVR6_9ROSI|nr:hypothetical protein JRO89_XS07G0278900 [Xanthoceras sorbifolium]
MSAFPLDLIVEILYREGILFHDRRPRFHFDSADNFAAAKILNLPIQNWGREFTIIGSCCGLLAISMGSHGPQGYITVVLWNISTNKFRILPRVCGDSGDIFGQFGFGYDVASDDYNLRANSWRWIEDLPDDCSFYSFHQSSGTLVAGTLNWMESIESRKSTDLIISFDLKSEKFHKVSLKHCRKDRLICRGSRCLSKEFRSMIDDPDFIRRHHNACLETNSNRRIIARNKTGTTLFSLDLDSAYNVLAAAKLPDLPIQNWRFGYDVASDEYKLVRISRKQSSTEFIVYSLRANSWSWIEHLPDYCSFYAFYQRSGILVAGTLNWMGKSSVLIDHLI